MSGETWTEYAVRSSKGKLIHFHDKEGADLALEALRSVGDNESIIVGRTVTASPWLPVQEQA